MQRPAERPSLFFWLYFFEGAPIGLIWWTIPTLLATSGIGVDRVTAMTAAAALPWSLKFLAAPAVDRFITTRRAHAFVIATFQSGMLICVGGLWAVPINGAALPYFLFFLSLCSALQDVVIDAWAIASVSDAGRGRVNGAMQAGMLSGRWVFGAGLLLLLEVLDWRMALGALSLMLAGSVGFLLSRFRGESGVIAPSVPRLGLQAFAFITERRFIQLGLIALTSGFAFESVGAVAGPFLVAQGLGRSQVGLLLSITVALMLAGAVVAGRLSDRRDPGQVFFRSGLALALAIAGLALLATGAPIAIVCSVFAAIYFLIGSFTASSYAFYMGQSRGTMEASRFTFLMAMTNLCEVAAGFTVGRLAAGAAGYPGAFLAAAGAGALGLILLRRFIGAAPGATPV